MKEDTRVRGPYEKGELPSQGERNVLIILKDEIMSGEITVEQIILERPHLYHQYGRTLNAIESKYMNTRHRSEMTQGFWLWGKTGVGKSHMARQIASNATIYVHTTKDKGWWDNYKQQSVVILDDFRGEIDYNELLKLVDKWPHYVSRRGTEPISFYSDCVIITSSLHPEDVYRKRDAEDSLDQLLRRFEICEIKQNAKASLA